MLRINPKYFNYFIVLTGCIYVTDLLAEENLLFCGFGEMTGLRDKKNVVQCEVKSRITITDAIINNGNCISPLEYIKSFNEQRKLMNLPNFVELKDFRKTYITGETFHFVVPDSCTLTEFTVSSTSKDYTWKTR